MDHTPKRVSNYLGISAGPDNKVTGWRTRGPSEVVGRRCTVIGARNTVSHDDCVVIGNGLKTSKNFELIIGTEAVQVSREMTEQEHAELVGLLRLTIQGSGSICPRCFGPCNPDSCQKPGRTQP